MSTDEYIIKYENMRKEYQRIVVRPMDRMDDLKRNEILLTTHSCAIEGNTFTVDNTRELVEKGLGMIPVGKTLCEAFEILDHLLAYDYLISHLDHPFNEDLLKEINRLVNLHTLSYKYPGSVPGEYTDVDMAAGETLFGDHKVLIKRVPDLLSSTEKALKSGKYHPMIIAARFHGFYEYLHPFKDGNGRTGRLLSNYILLSKKHPLLIIDNGDRSEYITALKMLRKENTDEYLIDFFFKTAIKRMQSEIDQKIANSQINIKV
jgi:Fic family protein